MQHMDATSSNTDKYELKEDRISLEKEKDDTKSEGWADQYNQNYDTKKNILNVAQKNTKNLEFAVSTKSSSFRHLHIQCKHDNQPKNCWNLTIDKRKRKKMSKLCGYSYLIKAIPNDSKWCVIETKNEYNHPMVKDVQVFYEHLKMLKADAKPSMIYEVVRSEDRTPTATRKDISNLSIQINSLEETALMAALITDKFIHLRECEALNAAITIYKKLASLSSNESEVLKYLD
ncbi:4116_t:CDS:2, partial [Racocetra fulgida]